MDIQKLQALAVIQEAGSFSRAAETLGYSQAGLTYMMNSLENEIGLRLLDRSYSGVRLSETGKTLMPKIHRLLQVYDALNGEINACKCAQQATLLRQYMHNTEIAVTMRLSTILKTIKQPL